MSVPRSASLRRLTAGALVLGVVPFAALGADASHAPAAGSAASAPGSSGPTVDARIATKCQAMSGDERSACIADARAAGASRQRHSSAGSHAAKPGHAASVAS